MIGGAMVRVTDIQVAMAKISYYGTSYHKIVLNRSKVRQ